MNVFHLLKNKSGKLALGAQQLAVTAVGAVALFYAGSAVTDNEVQKLDPIRTNIFAQRGTPTANAGMRRTKEGLSSINIANLGSGYNQVETDLSKVSKDDGPAFSDLDEDEMSYKMSGAFEGFGSDSNRAEEINPAYGGSGNAGYAYDGSYGDDGAYGGGSRAGKGGRGSSTSRGSYGSSNGGAVNSLSKASRATASGGVSMSPFGGRSGVGNFAAKSTNSEKHTLSGRMDGGTNAVSLRSKSAGTSSSQFNNTARRYGSTGEENVLSGKKLKDMASHSVALAKRTATNASNEMSDVFLASSQASGGLAIANDAGTDAGSASSSDLASPDKMNARSRRITKALDDVADKNEKRIKYASGLKKAMTALLVVTGVLCGLITAACGVEKVPIIGIAGSAAAMILAGVISAMWIAFSAAVGVYWNRYAHGEWNWFSAVMLGVAALQGGMGWITYAMQNNSEAVKSSSTSTGAVEGGDTAAQQAFGKLAGKGGKFAKVAVGALADQGLAEGAVNLAEQADAAKMALGDTNADGGSDGGNRS